jgi:hypothetical protein
VLSQGESESSAALFSGVSPLGGSPPEVTRNWLFVMRTALSPRAPSFLS